MPLWYPTRPVGVARGWCLEPAFGWTGCRPGLPLEAYASTSSGESQPGISLLTTRAAAKARASVVTQAAW